MSNSSKSGMPGSGGMADPLDFVKRLWGGMAVPGMAVPTVSVDELNQKIADLKAVESWLNMNMSMLRSTIQAMEVQSATLTTIQSMGAMMGAAMKPGDDGKPAFASFGFPGMTAPDKTEEGASAAPAGQFSYPNWPAPAPKPASASTAPPPAASAPSSASTPSPTPDDNTSTGKSAATGAPSGQESGTQPDFNTAMAAPAAWWNMLQNQFLQAVTQAMADNPSGSDAEQGAASNEGNGAADHGSPVKSGSGAKKDRQDSVAPEASKEGSAAKPARKPKT